MKLIRRQTPECAALEAKFHPLLARLYANRGITHPEELNDSLSGLADYQLLPNIQPAVELLFDAIETNKHIVIIGDFDADGATSTALMFTALRQMGATQISYLLPNRFKQGYGLSPEIVDLAQQRQAQLLITVDNGIASHAGVQRAHQYAIPVMITDHHLPGERLPDASVIVNPNLAGSQFPSKALAGVGVVFYIMLALRSFLRQRQWFNSVRVEPNLAELLDLVALGTVADVVPLDRNNRILVSQGLKRIRAGVTSPGILALLTVSKREQQRIVTSDLAYGIAPKLNAAGRLEDMSLGVALLLEKDSQRAMQLATRLNDLNLARRELEREMQQDALIYCEQLQSQLTELPVAFVLYSPEWHQGLVGIVAARIKEQFHRPVFAFAAVGDGILKGSGRAIAGMHIKDSLEEINRCSPDLMLNFGGHAMAAGVSLHEKNLNTFRQLLTHTLETKLDAEMLRGALFSDGELTAADFSLEMAQLLRYAAPWGQLFTAPTFDGKFKVLKQQIVGAQHLKLIIAPCDHTDLILEGIIFNIDTQQWPNFSVQQVHLVYQLDINYFRGEQKLQLIIQQITALS